MADMKTFACALADETRQKLSSMADADKMQLHRARVLDAESRPFWGRLANEVLAGIAAYDSCLMDTAVGQERTVDAGDNSMAIKWRYPRPQQLSVILNFERRRIDVIKSNLNGPGDAPKEFHLSVDRDDMVFASDEHGAPIGGPTEVAQAILKFMLAGSMA
jgi:hypothetical protein